jgi:hypothetical protein
MQTTIDNTMSVSFFTPFKLRRRGGHRMVILPEGGEALDIKAPVDQRLLQALVKATLWERHLRAGKVTTKDVARREGATVRYVQRILQLNFLAPDLKEAILEGRQPIELNLENMRLALPLVWEKQRQRFYCL